MNKAKKIGLIIFGVVFFLILLFFLLPNILGFFYKDIKLIDDSDLILGNVVVSQEENAYYDLMNIDSVDLGFDLELIEDHLAGKTWDENFVKEILSKNEKELDFLNQAVKRQKYQDPGSSSPEDFSLFAPLFSLTQYNGIARLSSLKAIHLARQGKNDEAIEEALKSIKIGQKMQDSQAKLIYYLVAIKMKGYGIDAIQEIINIADLSPESLIQYAEKIEEYRENKEWLINSFKGEYMIQKGVIDLTEEAIFNNQDIGLDENFVTQDIDKKYRKSFYFHPNKTKMIFAEYARQEIEDSQKPCGFVEISEIKTFDPPQGFKAMFRENLIGEMIHDIVAVKFKINKRSCDIDLQISATQALLAIKAYYINNQEYPTSLNELIPDYLEKIPIDPYSGEDIKYSKINKKIYSVGRELIDIGGSEGDDWTKALNPTFKINF